jgi:hypothetical protein
MREAAKRGFCVIRLKTAAVLKEAIGLYRAAGFTEVAETACGNCNLVMVKHLTTQSA